MFPCMVLSKVPCATAISNPQNALCESQELTASLHLDQLSALRPNLHNSLAALLLSVSLDSSIKAERTEVGEMNSTDPKSKR